jgi:hypothetical protein
MIKKLEKIIPMLNEIINLVEKSNLSQRNHDENISFTELENTPEETALLKYFENLTYEDIQLVQAIMYIGRDGKGYFVDEDTEITASDLLNKAIISFKDLHPNKKVAISHVTAKAPLDNYLRKGAEILNIQLN